MTNKGALVNGILPKTARVVILVALLVGLLSVLTMIVATGERAQLAVETELGELIDTIESTMRIACFVEDKVLAEEVVRGMLKNASVSSVEISIGERELVRSGSHALSNHSLFSVLPLFRETKQIVRNIYSPFDAEQYVCKVTLYPDVAKISSRILRETWFVCLLLTFQWLAIAGSLLILVLRNVVHPMKVISDQLHGLNSRNGEQLQVPSGHEHTEIGRLVSDVNALALNLQKAIDQAIAHSGELEEAKLRLEAQAQELEGKNASLARAMALREDVERIARHDLKTPLNSIAVIPGLLRLERKPTEAEEELFGVIERSVKRVLRMVNLSLDLYRMEEGGYVFQPTTVDIIAVTRLAVESLSEEATSKALKVDILTRDQYVWASADETLCYTILCNIVLNAIEASPVGASIRLLIESDETVRVDIHNFGAVPLQIRDVFFEKYATYGKAKGTGLGTYSARLMARAQHGDLDMETSDDHQGTTLKLKLMRADGSMHERSEPNHPIRVAVRKEHNSTAQSQELHVLLVDDDPDNALIFKRLLADSPFRIDTASNGLIALEACSQRHPDVIFMDIEMPILDGYESMRRIRELQAHRREVPSKIIAFSAHDDEASRIRSISEGFDMHLSKPSSKTEILGILSGRGVSESSVLSADTLRPNSVQCVDDDLFDMIPKFMESRQVLIEEYRHCLVNGDRVGARKLAHKLKGSFGMYGFMSASQFCRELEDNSMSADFESLSKQIQLLQDFMATLTIRPCRQNADISMAMIQG